MNRIARMDGWYGDRSSYVVIVMYKGLLQAEEVKVGEAGVQWGHIEEEDKYVIYNGIHPGLHDTCFQFRVYDKLYCRCGVDNGRMADLTERLQGSTPRLDFQCGALPGVPPRCG